jgi:hypothetical protein
LSLTPHPLALCLIPLDSRGGGVGAPGPTLRMQLVDLPAST